MCLCPFANPPPFSTPLSPLPPSLPASASAPAESKVPQAGLVGDMRISYAKFLQLLRGNRIKRLIIYGDLRTAIVEVGFGGGARQGFEGLVG